MSVVPLPSAIRKTPDDRAVIGTVQLGTDVNQDIEAALLISKFPGVNVRMTKLEMPSLLICKDTYEEALRNGSIAQAFRTISQPKGYVTVCGVGCTSMGFLIGRDRLEKCVPEGAKYVDMYQGVIQSLKTLNAKRIAMVTPYIAEVHEANIKVIEEQGMEVTKSMHFNCLTDKDTDRIDPGYIGECVEALVGSDNADVDVVFLGCSGMRVMTPGYISELEARVKVPVVTSTQAYYWLALRTAGVHDQLDGYGILFSKY